MSKPNLEEIKAQQDLLRRRLDEEEQALTNLAKRLWAQQESEKARLSRELHDGVGQLLTGLTRRLEGLSDDHPELQELRNIAELALSDVRQISRMMSPTILDDLGLKPALKWLCRSLFEHERANVKLTIETNAEELSKDISVLLFRITQEALVNSLKHSNADTVTLSLIAHHNVARLDIMDDGKGFNPDTVEAGIGLNSIADRTKAFDADFTLKSAINQGTHITIKVPL